MSQFKKAEAANPEAMMRAVAMTLGEYPADVVQCVVDPCRGIASRLKWAPSAAEVREECERFMAPRYAARRNAAARLEMAAQFSKPVVDEEEQARIAADHARLASRYESFVEEISGKAEALRTKDNPDAGKEAQLAKMADNNRKFQAREWAAKGVSNPPKISVALARILGVGVDPDTRQEAAE